MEPPVIHLTKTEVTSAMISKEKSNFKLKKVNKFEFFT